MFSALVCAGAQAQVNSGSNGSDGAFWPQFGDVVINMADHPNGIYQYISVNIPTNVTVTFIPNANNTPVVWLVQSNVVINGIVDVSGQTQTNTTGALGGPGGFRGGNGGNTGGAGQGPGGGSPDYNMGVCASYGSQGTRGDGVTDGVAALYGNTYLLPLLGGSGGGGATNSAAGGGGGGGAILIAASGEINLVGSIRAIGGSGSLQHYINYPYTFQGGGGSGGAVRLLTPNFAGTGTIDVSGGVGSWYFDNYYCGCARTGTGGLGRVRLDVLDNNFGGHITGIFTQGYQPIIIPTTGQGAQLTVTSVGGIPVSASPTGALSTPDAVLSALQNNPIPIIVSCANLPLNTQITVSVKPANGAAVSATSYNTTGTPASSTATISIVIPHGGGLIYATAATGN